MTTSAPLPRQESSGNAETDAAAGAAGGEALNFAREEEKILAFWDEINAFKRSMELSQDRPRFTFYDGPPFATGLPHYGHMLAGTIKDIVTRYAHMSGHHVERRFGWDCHGLPVEYEIDKKLGIKDRQMVLDMGIDVYNAECRAIVMRYRQEWRRTVRRIGRWIDMENDYKTLDTSFMESVWWVFKQVFDKDQVYRGYRIMPFSTGCHTPLSNFEANQNYKDVQDPAVTVGFALVDDPSVSLLAWTTTPWTLPSNLALCVHPEFTYVKIRDGETSSVYVLLESRLEMLYKNPKKANFEVLAKFTGREMEGWAYEPLFPYFETEFRPRGAFRVVCDTYVTDDSGVGIVHNAPGFGEDDFRVCLQYKIVTETDVPCPIDDAGRFTEAVAPYAGTYVKDADKAIARDLKARGRLVRQASVTHSYPFCWRSDTPLLYKAVPSWFVRVANIVPQLLSNNRETYWVPDSVKEKRFANWLENARDWNISRNRFWGTPIPLWVSEDFAEVVCIGSVQELEDRTGATGITDLHRDKIDGLTIPSSRAGAPPLRRIDEVFDCWFESGSMPYASQHYPFEGREHFTEKFPANFIAEGLDQTRGWFYTLLVLSTHLFNKPPAQNVVVNGLVLAADGKKMSKRLKNYPEPTEILDRYGADAVRLYLINSPVVRGETLRFKEEGVRETLAKVFIPWYNCYRFMQQQVDLLAKESAITFKYDAQLEYTNVMDQWIMANTQSLVEFIHTEMAGYRLYTVVPRLLLHIDELTNWYVRFNRRRMKGRQGVTDAVHSLNALCDVLLTLCKAMAPLAPFASEMIYQKLRPLVPNGALSPAEQIDPRSVHFLEAPTPRTQYFNVVIERRVKRMQSVIEQARQLRDKKVIPLKTPLRELVVVAADAEVRDDLAFLEAYIKEELNVRTLTVTADEARYGIKHRLEPDHRALGQRLKKEYTSIRKQLAQLSLDDAHRFMEQKSLTVNGVHLYETELAVVRFFDAAQSAQYEASFDRDMVVILDVTLDESLKEEGLVRDFCSRVQRLRKKAGIVPTDAIVYFARVTADPDGELASLMRGGAAALEEALQQPLRLDYDARATAGRVVAEEGQEIGRAAFDLCLVSS